MTNVRQLPPSELDLQAYLDDELAPEDRLRVIEWLLENPARAQELFEVQLREDLLRVSVKLSVNQTSFQSAPSGTKKENESINLERYDRFTIGFAVAASLALILFLITTFVS
ncbi:MAG: hypothetical protein AAFW68_01600 [Pseudomonadota bacterium]